VSLQGTYRERFAHNLTLDTGAMTPQDIAAKVQQALSAP
jgi:hypothetical protein